MCVSVWCRNKTTCLCSGLTRSLGFGCHGSLQLDGEAGIFAAKENGVTAHDLAPLLQQLYSIAIPNAVLPLPTQRCVSMTIFLQQQFFDCELALKLF